MPGEIPWSDLAVAACLLAGGLFLFVAGLGILRLPDVLIRMHASTKAGTLGVGLVFTGAALYFGNAAETAIAGLTIIFLLVTAPVAAHAIARAAYRMNVPLSDRTHLDEWKGKYGGVKALRNPGNPDRR
ncbi:MAG: monovalent cation/H(+) antiporter subunit G [Chloroflexi bacterium]|nr:monovalent cation/H(+) antiporter subunit G [Chloroflexota bacterium]